MPVRAATAEDSTGIRETADRSFQASYSLSPGQIEAILEEVFSGEALSRRIDDPDACLLVAEEDGAVVGFADAEVGDAGTLRWLHVHPDARGRGVGTSLVERVREELGERGVDFRAHVLEEASEGGEFLEQFGLKPTDSVELELAGETFFEHVYTTGGRAKDANEPAIEVPTTVDVDGEERPVGSDEEIPGTEAPFFPIYASSGSTERYGFLCSNCGSTDVAANDLDRLECGNCGNTHLADEWDAAYL